MTALAALLFCEKLFLWFVFYSFCGWVYETVLISVQQRHFVNRGFLNGPYCPIYGAGAIAIYLLLWDVSNPFALFVAGGVVACILEYVTSYVLEKAFGARWWDYSQRPFNLNGRTCLGAAVVFGAFSLVFVKVVHPPVMAVTDMIPMTVLHILAIAFVVILGADTTVTIAGLVGFSERVQAAVDAVTVAVEKLKTQTSERAADATAHNAEVLRSASAIRDAVVQRLTVQQRRMLHAFPQLNLPDRSDLIPRLRELIDKRHRR